MSSIDGKTTGLRPLFPQEPTDEEAQTTDADGNIVASGHGQAPGQTAGHPPSQVGGPTHLSQATTGQTSAPSGGQTTAQAAAGSSKAASGAAGAAGASQRVATSELDSASRFSTVASDVGRVQQALSGNNTLLATPPPLPPGRPKVTAQTAQLYQGLSQDVNTALSRGMPTSAVDLSATTQQILSANPNTAAGQAQLTHAIGTAINGSLSYLNSSNDAAMMAAFMELTVRNQSSGKELQGNMLNMATEARNSQIQQGIDERAAQAKALKKAQDKQKALGPLNTIFQALLLVASAIVTVMTLGGGALAMAAVAGAMVAGGVIGGAVEGKKKGTGFDLNGMLKGAMMATDLLGLGALAKGAVKIAMKYITKAMGTVSPTILRQGGQAAAVQGARAGASAAASTAANQTTRQASSVFDNTLMANFFKRADELSQKAATALQKVASKTGISKIVPQPQAFNSSLIQTSGQAMGLTVAQIGVDALSFAQQVGQLVSDYKYKQLTLDARQHEANAKGNDAMVDDAQRRWDAIQKAIENITTAHNNAVDQTTEMINRHAALAKKAAGIVHG